MTNTHKSRKEICMASNYAKILSGEKVLCDICKKGVLEPCDKEIPIEKVNEFKCSFCGEELHIVRKLKLNK